MYWTDGKIEIKMTLDDARSISHQGQCDDDVKALSKTPKIKKQLAKLDAVQLIKSLKEYGAWDATELADHEQNLQRILWIAGVNIAEENRGKRS